MNVKQINDALSRGALDEPGLFPHADELERLPFVFVFEFGLDTLPEQGGYNPNPGTTTIWEEYLAGAANPGNGARVWSWNLLLSERRRDS